MKKSIAAGKVAFKLNMEHWDSGSEHAVRNLGVISSAGVFNELGNMLSKPWSDSLLFAPVIDEASISKRQITSEIRKKAQVTYRCTQQHLHATIHLRYRCFIIVLRPIIL